MLAFKIESMTCNHCVSRITKAIAAYQADVKIEADLTTKTLKINSEINKEDILNVLNEAEYPAVIYPANIHSENMLGSCCS